MYLVVDMNELNRIVWSDTKLCNSKEMANSRKEFFERKCPKKNYRVIRMTKFAMVS